VSNFACNSSKIEKVLGWKPTISFEDGLKKTSDWYKENYECWKGQMDMRLVPVKTEDGKVELH
jgi:dTDP-glucose 4,6-dehydratase